MPHAAPPPAESSELTRSFLGVFRYSGRALELVWSTSRGLTVALVLLTLAAGLLPAGIAWVGKEIVDAVVTASRIAAAGGQPALATVFQWVVLEGLLVARNAACRCASRCCERNWATAST